MPHYADGTLAHVGDQVYGKPYTVPHKVAGQICAITSEGDSCNCMVAFVEGVDFNQLSSIEAVTVVSLIPNELPRFFKLRTEYGEVRAFVKLGSVFEQVIDSVMADAGAKRAG